MKRRPAMKPAAKPAVRAPAATLLAAALRTQSDGVFIAESRLLARGLKIIYVNASFCAMTGHPPEALVGRPHGTLHLEKSDLARLKAWLRTSNRRESLAGEGYLVRSDATTIYAAWNFDALRDAGGRVTHVVGSYRDTTEKRRLQEALVHSQRLDAVGRLAGGVAHDFNNLISVINGYSQILAGQLQAQPQALREVEEIHKAAQKAASLTRQLLAFSRRQAMNSRVFNLNQVVTENRGILARLLGGGVHFDTTLDPELRNVRADPAQLQQVLLNLVINARDAVREKGTVTVATANRTIAPGLNRRVTDTPPGRYVSLTVRDNGTGMDASTRAHLFEPFFTTKEEGKGTGLGLALVYGVVQQSGGFINVRSAPGEGSTFDLLFPAVQEPAELVSTPSLTSLSAVRGDETVLLVEEDAVVSKMVAGILTSDGYRVLTAPNPAEGLRQARAQERPVQLLIAGLGPPGSETESLARALNVTCPSLRILNTGAGDNLPLPWLARQHQTSLPKPFALSELLEAARALLDTR